GSASPGPENRQARIESDMKVRDLVKQTKWELGRADAAIAPLVSVLLLARGSEADEAFERAVDSIRKQSLTDLELIIIAEGSDERTRKRLRTFSDIDHRISAIESEYGFGLPALLINEALSRARGKFVMLASSQFVFARGALSGLVDVAERSPA